MTGKRKTYRERLQCTVPQIDDIFVECLANALHVLDEEGVEKWLYAATKICNLGRGMELVLIVLEEGVELVQFTDITVLEEVVKTSQYLSDHLCGKAVNPFLSTLIAIARRLGSTELMVQWFKMVEKVAHAQSERSEVNVSRYEGVAALLTQAPYLFNQISLGGMNNWIDAGLNSYKNQNHRLQDYFSLQSADSHAMLQRERHGTLYMDYERQINMFLRAFFGLEEEFKPYSLAFDIARKPTPHLDKRGFHVPDVHDDVEDSLGGTVSGIDRYRAMIAHLAAHRRWSQPYLADNFSPFQHIAIECFEDARIEALVMQRYPGMRRLWQRLHPVPVEGDCPDEGWSPVRHLLAMQSRALLDPDHPYEDICIVQFVKEFNEEFAKDPLDAQLSVRLGVKWLLKNQTVDFRLANIWFENTQVSYRDDNRYLWIFLEAADGEDDFHSDHAATNREAEADGNLPPQHYHEWDYQSQSYRPDYATVYETIQDIGNASYIDGLLDKHKQLTRRLKQIVDLLKPQQRKRVRYQSEGDEMDMDVLLRAWTDFKAGSIPDTRYYQSHVKDGRNISVLLLLDLSQSINEVPEGCSSTILQLSQEAVSVLSEAIEALGDPFAIAGFASNTRHEVRYTHFKGFSEHWDRDAKGRLANMEGGYSTRMGAALRHGARYLDHRSEEKKILFLLTDGAPRDIDVFDEQYLYDDTHKAVVELEQKGINTFCITLDTHADEYVAGLFGTHRYAVIDQIERLPEKLPQLFIKLTG
ncbi:MAG: VWA domain-containing protein [bacterium]|nr:VWA domain-containing protein [bacterium]